jgi:hypothetical protein
MDRMRTLYGAGVPAHQFPEAFSLPFQRDFYQGGIVQSRQG